jgi:hypothetical protein
MEDIKETFFLSLPVALSGIIGTELAGALYPPLPSNPRMAYVIPALFFAGALIVVVMLGRRLTKYATFVRLVIVSVAAIFVMPAAYFFLNGILDGSPSIEVPSRVVGKYVGGRGGHFLVVSLSWERKRVDQNFRVNVEDFSVAEPGDYVRVVIHPGVFSQAWSDNVLLGK